MNSITNAISLAETAGQHKTLSQSKDAYKQIQVVVGELFRNTEERDDAFMQSLARLIQVGIGLYDLPNKYGVKIQDAIETLIYRKGLLEREPLLLAGGRQFYFAGDPDPLALPPSELKLLCIYAETLQADWESFKDGTSTKFYQISRTQFKTIMEHLKKREVAGVHPDDLFGLYQAADFLGIAFLRDAYSGLLRESLADLQPEALLKILCETAIGKANIHFAEPVFYAYLEVESRLAMNVLYLLQPDIAQYVAGFCKKHNQKIEVFHASAAKRCPLFYDYIVAGNSHPIHELIVKARKGQSLSCDQLKRLNDLFDSKHYETAAAYMTRAFGIIMVRKFISCKAQQILDRALTNKEELRQNPCDWLQAQEQAFKAGHYQEILAEINASQAEVGNGATERLKQAYNYYAFLCWNALGNEQEAENAAGSLTVDAIPKSEFRQQYFYFVLEKGWFDRLYAEYPVFDPEIADLEALYKLDLTRQSSQFKEIAAVLWFRGKRTGTLTRRIAGIEFNLKLDSPIASLQEHCKLHPRQALPRILLSQILYKSSENDEQAIQYCSEALALQKNPAILLRRALLNAKQGNFEEAHADFLELQKLENTPANAERLARFLAGADFLSLHKLTGLADNPTSLSYLLTQFIEKTKLSPLILSTGAEFQNLRDIVIKIENHPEWQDNPHDLAYWDVLSSITSNAGSGMKARPDMGDLFFFAALDKDPVECEEELKKMDPSILNAGMYKNYIAHRLGRYEELTACTGVADRAIVADAYRRRGDLIQAQAILGEDMSIPFFSVVRAAIMTDNSGTTPGGFLSNGLLYKPFRELQAQLHVDGARNNSFDKLKETIATPDGILFLHAKGKLSDEQILAYKKRGYQSPALDQLYHQILAKQNKFGLVNESGPAAKAYAEAGELFKTGRYDELIAAMETAENLGIQFLVAKSHFEVGNLKQAQEIIKKIKAKAIFVGEYYPKSFFADVVEWAKLNLQEPNKKARKQ